MQRTIGERLSWVLKILYCLDKDALLRGFSILAFTSFSGQLSLNTCQSQSLSTYIYRIPSIKAFSIRHWWHSAYFGCYSDSGRPLFIIKVAVVAAAAVVVGLLHPSSAAVYHILVIVRTHTRAPNKLIYQLLSVNSELLSVYICRLLSDLIFCPHTHTHTGSIMCVA